MRKLTKRGWNRSVIKISHPNASRERDIPARKAPQYTDSTQTLAV